MDEIIEFEPQLNLRSDLNVMEVDHDNDFENVPSLANQTNVVASTFKESTAGEISFLNLNQDIIELMPLFMISHHIHIHICTHIYLYIYIYIVLYI